MASGKLGSVALVANTNTSLGSPSATKISTVNINFCNQGVNAVRIRLAINAGGAPAVADYTEYDKLIAGNDSYEVTGVVCSPGETVWVYASTANVSVRAHFFEE